VVGEGNGAVAGTAQIVKVPLGVFFD